MQQSNYKKVFEIALGLLSLFFLVVPNSITLLLLLFFVVLFIGYKKKHLRFEINRIFVFFALFYLAYLIGICFTKDFSQAMKYAENKLSFLIIPLLFSVKPTFKISLKYPVYGLVLGTIILCLIGISTGLGCYSEHGWFFYCFSTVNISPIHHPSYYDVFLILAVSSSWFAYLKKERGFSLYWLIPYSIFIVILHVFTFSFAGLLFLLLAIFVVVFAVLYKKVGKKRIIGFLSLAFLLAFSLFYFVPELQTEVNETKQSVGNFLNNPINYVENAPAEPTGNEVRLIMWTVSLQEIMKHPLGVGTGSVDYYLSRRLIAHNQEKLALNYYNPHNQFLQTTLELGIFGLLILLMLIISVFKFSLKHRNWILFILISNFCFNSLFESMFQRQSGIVFYTLWIAILVLYSLSTKTQENEN